MLEIMIDGQKVHTDDQCSLFNIVTGKIYHGYFHGDYEGKVPYVFKMPLQEMSKRDIFELRELEGNKFVRILEHSGLGIRSELACMGFKDVDNLELVEFIDGMKKGL